MRHIPMFPWILILAFAFQAQAYFPVSKILPMDRYRNLDKYENHFPACTLNLDLNTHGASGYMDVYFNANTTQYRTTDSLEAYSVLCLPRAFSVDSMVLWVSGEPQPAQLISIGQAEATYNQIVYVTRKDPAYIRRINGYPDNYGYYPFRPYENQYELKVFPIFQGGSRHVRVFLDCHADIKTGFNSYDLGFPQGTVIRVNTQKSTGNVPSVSAGTLSLVAMRDKIGYQITGVGENSLTLTLAPPMPFNKGYAGVIQTTGADRNFFKVQLDLARMFNLDALAHKRKVTFVWVPGGSHYSAGPGAFDEEKTLLQNYLAGFQPQEKFNVIYAGGRVEMFEPHMISAAPGVLARASGFIGARVNVDADGMTPAFDALVSAFGSMASNDVPAVVFCLDRGAIPQNGASVNWGRVDSMKNVLVSVNVNRAKFYAWVHWSKAYFYGRIASALGGSITYYDPSVTYRYPYTTRSQYDFTLIDKVFGPGPVLSNPQVTFDASFSNVIMSRQRAGCDLEGVLAGTRVDLLGQCSVNYVAGTVTALIDGEPYESSFVVTGQGSEATGLNLNKLWAFDMVEVFAQDKTFFSYSKKRDYVLSAPEPEFASLSGSILYNATTYRKMVDISLENRVVTGATALLALEPGMDLEDTDRFSEGDNPATGVTEKPVKDKTTGAGLTALPNPFNPHTTIRLAAAGLHKRVTLHIYAPDGRLVRTFTASPVNGSVMFQFDGRDSLGRRLASGVYLARAFSGKKVWQMKLMLMK